jgi:hypothetical protein
MSGRRLRWASFLAPNMGPVDEFISAFVGDRLGFETSLSIGRSFEMRERPELAKRIKVIDGLGPSTIQPVVAAARIDKKLTDDLRQVLIELARDKDARQAIAYGSVDRREEIDDSAYDDIRSMHEVVESAGVTLTNRGSLPQ